MYVVRGDGECCESSFCVVKNYTRSRGPNSNEGGGSRERKGFMVKVWWAELEQEE